MTAAPLPIDLSALPPELRAAVAAALEAERGARIRLEAENATLAERNARLEHLVREFRQALYGKKPEELSREQLELAFEDLETAVAELEATGAPPDATLQASLRSEKPVNRNLGRLPKELPRIERVIEPESTLCACGCGEMTRIGEGETDQKTVRWTVFPPNGGAARHHAGAVPGDRDDPAEIRLPVLPERRGPGAGAAPPHRRRAADRGRDRPSRRMLAFACRRGMSWSRNTPITARSTARRRSPRAPGSICIARLSPAGSARRRSISAPWSTGWRRI